MTLSIRLTLVVAIVAALSAGCGQKGAAERGGGSTSSASVLILDDSNFDDEIASGVVLVDFWAAWCGPCRIQGPIVEEVAEQIEGQAKIAKLDVDAAPSVAKRFNIRSIPTLIVFKDGEQERKFVGVTKAEALVSAITTALDSE